MKPIFLFIILLSIFNISVFSQTPERITIGQNITKIEQKNISLFVKNIQYIPLETTPECLLDQDISQIELFNNELFVSDYKYIFRFDKNGKFIKKIGVMGQGPGEYTQGFQNFIIDNKNNHLIIFDMISQRMITYDFNGQFVYEKKTDFLPGRFDWINDNHFATYNMGFTYEKTPWSDFYVIDREANTIHKNKFKKEADKKYGLTVFPPVFYHFQGKLRYKNPHENIIYEITENGKTKPIYYLDFGVYESKNEVDEFEIRGKKGNLSIRANPKSYEKIGITEMSESAEFLFINFAHKNEKQFGVYDKVAKTFYTVYDSKNKLYGFTDDILEGIPVYPKLVIYNNNLYSYFDAYYLIVKLKGKTKNPDLQKIINSLDIGDNPVVIIGELKEAID